MGCCGQNRQMYIGGGGSGSTRTEHAEYPNRPMRVHRSVAYFKYTGENRLTVIGPRTGKRYLFEKKGAVLQVDLRDRASMLNVPGLIQTRGGEAV